jgi:hypothetical protein
MKSRIILITALLATVVLVLWPAGKMKSQTSDVVMVGAGNIAEGEDLDLSGAMATAALVEATPGTVFALGDLAYLNGEETDFAKAYDPAWGRFRSRTLPVVGNHDYYTTEGAAYFNYFGPAAGDPSKGYYSLDLGAWHIVVLNGECARIAGGCGIGSPEEVWLKNDLATHTQPCTLAMWHEPMFTSTPAVTPETDMLPMWQDLYDAGADLILNAHAHNYERFAPQDPNGNLDVARGIVEIIVGTGGIGHFSFSSTPAPNSLMRNSTTFGVLKLTLHATSYDWQFLPVAGQTFTDSGTQVCH